MRKKTKKGDNERKPIQSTCTLNLGQHIDAIGIVVLLAGGDCCVPGPESISLIVFEAIATLRET